VLRLIIGFRVHGNADNSDQMMVSTAVCAALSLGAVAFEPNTAPKSGSDSSRRHSQMSTGFAPAKKKPYRLHYRLRSNPILRSKATRSGSIEP